MEDSRNIYKICRKLKRKESSLYNILMSIYVDSIFVREISSLWPSLPVLANQRCGSWYVSSLEGASCYFKSTDGHTGNWSFSQIRLNVNVCQLAAQHGGCIIVDATKKGKRFPDSLSKTIPIWACVLNRAIASVRERSNAIPIPSTESEAPDFAQESKAEKEKDRSLLVDEMSGWDTSLHFPSWVSDTEAASVESRVQAWVQDFLHSGADVASLAATLVKPLRPLWISQSSLIWTNEVPDASSWPFTPLILLSASTPHTGPLRLPTPAAPSLPHSHSLHHHQQQHDHDGDSDGEPPASSSSSSLPDHSAGTFLYIPGAADDEESWSQGLTHTLFWAHHKHILFGGDGGAHSAPQRTRQVVVREQQQWQQHAGRGHLARQRWESRSNGEGNGEERGVDDVAGVHWLGATGLGVGMASTAVVTAAHWECSAVSHNLSVVSCGAAMEQLQPHREEDAVIAQLKSSGRWLLLPIVSSKISRHSISDHLGAATAFAKQQLAQGCRVLVICRDGVDICVSVCLAILMSCFGDKGTSNGKQSCVTKVFLRQSLAFITSFHANGRPTRGNLKQVYAFLSQENGILGPFVDESGESSPRFES